MLVVQREILPRRLYTACAIGLALAMWALFGASEAVVRARVSPFAIVGAAAFGSWITLRRWAKDAGCGRLFETSRASPKDFTLRQEASLAAAALGALARRAGSARLMPPSWAALFIGLCDRDLRRR